MHNDDFCLYAPISKINEEKRTVAGYATTESVDKQGEIVDYAGSKEAFNSWGKNIREMHEPKAVGKAVEIIPDDETKKVWVEAYISKGAEDTWQKVKDGTLTGFSIGGQTVHKNVQIVKDLATGGSRTVTRITKYRLNELSLVDNPANAGCSFELVKSVDGVPFQTEIVEDSNRLVISEAVDPLMAEIHSHRDKVDSLTKKVLDREELDQLSDDSYGVIRKYKKDDAIIKERLLPMSDKVHAVTALAIMEKYNLAPDEVEAVHKKAQAILGSAYQTHNVSNRGGINEMTNDDVNKISAVIETLVKKVEALEKAFEGAYRPVPGAKATPENASATPALTEKSAPSDKELGDLVTATAANETEKAMAGTENGNIVDAPVVQPSAVETPAVVAVPVVNVASLQPDAPAGATLPPTSNPVDAAAVAPSAPAEPEAAAEVMPEVAIDSKEALPKEVEKAADKKEDPKEEAAETKAEEKKEDEEEKKKQAKKLADDKSEQDLSKVVNELETLRKRFDAVTELLKKPMPRKRIIEKNADTPESNDSKFQSQRDEVLTWVKSGKPLTAEQEKVREDVLNKSMDAKFGKAL